MEMHDSALPSVVDDLGLSPLAHVKHWLRYEAAWFLASLTGHVVVLLVVLLVLSNFGTRKQDETFPPEEFDAAMIEPKDNSDTLVHIDATIIPSTPEPPPPATDITQYDPPPSIGGESESNETSPNAGGRRGKEGVLVPGTTGERQEVSIGCWGNNDPYRFGKGNGPTGPLAGTPLRQRGTPRPGTGITPQSERSVAAALYWISRHQLPDGHWSLSEFDKKCTDKTCTGHGESETDAGATGLGLLPFLAAGCTSEKKGPYQENVGRGVYWLVSHQNPKDGDLAVGSKGNAHMYAHAIATIALCEAYAMSPREKETGRAAQAAINFIVAAQNAGTGGWRYEPGQDGDTSVVGWQVMALKSAQMAYLNVPKSAFDGADKWLKSCSSGNYGEQFSYQPGGGATPTMSSVGLLCSQYLHLRKDDPKLQGGLDYLLKHLPNNGERDIYYWYYATQVMHNVPGQQWDEWNRAMRKILTESQVREGCAAGSWDPARPSNDRWGPAGGRLMVTCLSCLTLEVYYRYLPLFQLDQEERNRSEAK